MDELEGNRESIYHRDTVIFAVNTAISSMNRRSMSRKAILTDFDSTLKVSKKQMKSSCVH